MNKPLLKMFGIDRELTEEEYAQFLREMFSETANYDPEIERHDRALFRRSR